MPVSGAYADPLPAMTDGTLRQYLTAATGRQVSRVLASPEPLLGGIENRNYKVTAAAEGERVCFVLRFPPEKRGG